VKTLLTLFIAAIAAAFAFPLTAGAAPSMLGTWDVPCCNGAYHFTMRITGETGDSFSGIMINQATGLQDSEVRGRQTGDGVAFDRTGSWGAQHWTARLVVEGSRLRMAGGRWSGTGSSPSLSPEFSGVQTSGGGPRSDASASPAPAGQSLAGDWELYCCGDTHHWTLRISREGGGTFSGDLLDLNTGRPESQVSGRTDGAHIAFDRTGPGLLQHWTAALVGAGRQQKMTDGRWDGTGSDMGFPLDFHAERPGAATAAAPPVAPPPARPPARPPTRPDVYAGGGHNAVSAPSVTIYEAWNSAGCGFTDSAALPLGEPVRLDRIQLWFNWRAGETSAPFVLLKDGVQIAQGQLSRGDCDPYQAAWCNAEADIGIRRLAPGDYTVQVAIARVCQNAGSNGRGFIRAWGAAD